MVNSYIFQILKWSSPPSEHPTLNKKLSIVVQSNLLLSFQNLVVFFPHYFLLSFCGERKLVPGAGAELNVGDKGLCDDLYDSFYSRERAFSFLFLLQTYFEKLNELGNLPAQDLEFECLGSNSRSTIFNPNLVLFLLWNAFCCSSKTE